MVPGGLFVTLSGMAPMLQWCADNLDTSKKVYTRLKDIVGVFGKYTSFETSQ